MGEWWQNTFGAHRGVHFPRKKISTISDAILVGKPMFSQVKIAATTKGLASFTRVSNFPEPPTHAGHLQQWFSAAPMGKHPGSD